MNEFMALNNTNDKKLLLIKKKLLNSSHVHMISCDIYHYNYCTNKIICENIIKLLFRSQSSIELMEIDHFWNAINDSIVDNVKFDVES